MQHLLRKIKQKEDSYKYHWKSSGFFYILELKCMKKDIPFLNIYQIAGFNLYAGCAVKLSQPLECYRQENYK